MQIICTGATGLVGYNFVNAALARGHKVVALSNEADFPQMKNVECVKADLTDLSAIERLVLDRFPDAIVNCAAISSPAVVDKNPTLSHKINVALPERLAQLANHVSARIIHLSSDMVFDGKSAPYKNTDMPYPNTLYGTTKLMAEKAVLKYAAPLSVVLRIAHVCGMGLKQNRSFNEKLFLAFMRGEKQSLADNDFRSFEPASRVGELMVEFLERSNISGIHHYCGLESLSRYEAAHRICEHFKLDPEKFLERTHLDEDVNMTLDMSSLDNKIKTPAVMFSETLLDMRVPDACLEWYKNETGTVQIKRFKL